MDFDSINPLRFFANYERDSNYESVSSNSDEYSQIYTKQTIKQLLSNNLVGLALKHPMPIGDQLRVVALDTIIELVDSAIEYSNQTRFKRQAPMTISNYALNQINLVIHQNDLNIERTDFIGNTFGENINIEPQRVKKDNWMRNNIHTYSPKAGDSDLKKFELHQVNRLTPSHEKLKSFPKIKPERQSFALILKEREKAPLPEPVEIDNQPEDSSVAKESRPFCD